MAIDVLGPLLVMRYGNKLVLLIVDTFYKWPEAVSLPDETSTTIAVAFIIT